MWEDLAHRRGLLISVRDESEAQIAESFADVVDVKDPARGALGAASTDTWNAVCDVVTSKPISLALGDADDWNGVTFPQVPDRVAAVKLGPSRSGSQRQVLETRQRFNDASERPLPWVSVLYADRPHSREDWIDSAVVTGCVALLVDTADKTGLRLPEIWSESVFESLRDASSDAGLPLVLAGRLQLDDVQRLAPYADLIGVRSAACAANNRQLGISAANAEACRAALDMELAG